MTTDWIQVGTLEELRKKGHLVVSGTDRPIAVFYHEGKVRAVDNRCPHMGFPLHQGSVQDGILTCHWHHARFDLASGCTFDLWADDVPTFPTRVQEGVVWVQPTLQRDDESRYWMRRLREGMQQNIGLIIAKALIALLRLGVAPQEIVREGVLFGTRYRDGWSSGLTILTAMANLVPLLPEEERFLALYQGIRRVAADCAGQVPRRERYALEGSDASDETLLRWFRYWTLVRHRDGAERTLLTLLDREASQEQAAEMLLTAATDRFYADGGHALDFINKALEATDLIGWDHASETLPTVVRQLVAARGGEELNAWRHPTDLVPLVREAEEHLESWFQQGHDAIWQGEVSLAEQILGDDPAAILEAIGTAIREGARATQLSKALAYAAALRLARFGSANEFGDWITALHTFTYCNALHQGIKRLATLDGDAPWPLVRGVLHGAMSVYLDRFLNVPPAHLPGERRSLDQGPSDPQEIRESFLKTLDQPQRMDQAGWLVARYLWLGHRVEPLFAVLAQATLREDADFHTFQMLEASLQQYHEWGNTQEGRNILVALARYLAAHAPTQRTQLQTAQIALRLHRGESLYEEADDS